MTATSWPRLRTALRLARRQLRRAPATSALVAALVALPVAALAGSATFWQSQQPSTAQQVALELGQAQSWLGLGGSAGMRQYVDQPNMMYSDTDDPGGGMAAQAAADVAAAIPPGARVIPVSEYASTVVVTADGRSRVDTTVGEVWDPLLAGRYLLLAGRAPASDFEAMVSPGLLEHLGARLGDEVTLGGVDARYTITGLLRRADVSPDRDALFLPPAAREPVGTEWSKWYVGDWQPAASELDGLNARGVVAYARDVVLDPPPGAHLARSSASSLWSTAMLATSAAVFGGYLTVLLAGAALSVSARRQQRTLAVVASLGAERADVFRVVLLQGTVLGVTGGAAGAATGIGLAAAVLAITDRGVAGSVLSGNWGFQVPWALIAGILVFAIAAGTIAAIAPARAASRGDTIAALRGARRPGRIHARRPIWGLVVLVTGLALGGAGGATVAAIGTPGNDDPAAVVRTVALCGIVVGPVLVQIGVILAGHWLLALCARALAPLGLASRLASRDAAANPSRVVPAFAAIAACVFLASFALSATAISAAASARNYSSVTPIGTLQVSMWAADSAEIDALVPAAQQLAQAASPTTTALLSQPAWPDYLPTGRPADPEFMIFRAAQARAASACTTGCANMLAQAGTVAIVAPEDAETVVGTPIDASALDLLREGGALTLGQEFLFDDGTVRITRWRAADLDAGLGADTADPSGPVAEVALPAVSLDLERRTPFPVLITPDTARGLGITVVPQSIVAGFDRLPDASVLERLQAEADIASMSGTAGLGVWLERGPSTVDPWLWLLSAVAAVLVVGASTVCLGLARVERRPDDATLAAVGGERPLRRAVNAWQALVIVGIGSVTGAAAGALPMLGIAAGSSGYLNGCDTPWPWLTGLAIALPVVIAAVSWLVPPRRPDLTRRTVIA